MWYQSPEAQQILTEMCISTEITHPAAPPTDFTLPIMVEETATQWDALMETEQIIPTNSPNTMPMTATLAPLNLVIMPAVETAIPDTTNPPPLPSQQDEAPALITANCNAVPPIAAPEPLPVPPASAAEPLAVCPTATPVPPDNMVPCEPTAPPPSTPEQQDASKAPASLPPGILAARLAAAWTRNLIRRAALPGRIQWTRFSDHEEVAPCNRIILPKEICAVGKETIYVSHEGAQFTIPTNLSVEGLYKPVAPLMASLGLVMTPKTNSVPRDASVFVRTHGDGDAGRCFAELLDDQHMPHIRPLVLHQEITAEGREHAFIRHSSKHRRDQITVTSHTTVAAVPFSGRKNPTSKVGRYSLCIDTELTRAIEEFHGPLAHEALTCTFTYEAALRTVNRLRARRYGNGIAEFFICLNGQQPLVVVGKERAVLLRTPSQLIDMAPEVDISEI